MKVEQIYSLVNTITNEVLGDSAIVKEDLSNVVEIGQSIEGAIGIDNYVKKLVDHIGKVIFVDRPYFGTTPSVVRDAWEFGSILEKIQADMPTAIESDTWNLVNGNSYDPYVFFQPSVSALFFNDRVAYDIPISFTERQVKSSFSSPTQLNGFLSMIFNSAEKAMSLKLDELVMRTINTMIAQTVFAESPATPYQNRTGLKAVNVLKLYNDRFNKSLTAEASVTDPEFIRYCAYLMSLYTDRLAKMSTLFNIGQKQRFTPKTDLSIILLSEFKESAGVYLQSDTFHDSFVALPQAESVPYWQGNGQDFSFAHNSSIDVEIKNLDPDSQVTKPHIQMSGIIGVMFDRNAVGVANLDRRVTSSYNPRAEFFTNYYKMDAGYYMDHTENFIVFYVADPVEANNTKTGK